MGLRWSLVKAEPFHAPLKTASSSPILLSMEQELNLTQSPSADPLAALEGSIMARRRSLTERLRELEGSDALIELREGRELRGRIAGCRGGHVTLEEGGSIPVVAIRGVAEA
jgi:hypothetical protein